MNPDAISRILEKELKKEEPFDNWHGINQTNLSQFLISPQLIEIDDSKAGHRITLWVVLQTGEGDNNCIIAYHPVTLLWILADRGANGAYKILARTKRLAKALTKM